jgi:hypothetical protein
LREELQEQQRADPDPIADDWLKEVTDSEFQERDDLFKLVYKQSGQTPKLKVRDLYERIRDASIESGHPDRYVEDRPDSDYLSGDARETGLKPQDFTRVRLLRNAASHPNGGKRPYLKAEFIGARYRLLHMFRFIPQDVFDEMSKLVKKDAEDS